MGTHVMEGLPSNIVQVSPEIASRPSSDVMIEQSENTTRQEHKGGEHLSDESKQAQKSLFQEGQTHGGSTRSSHMSESKWTIRAEVTLPHGDSMCHMAGTPSEMVAIGCHSVKGLLLYSPDGKLRQTVLSDIKVCGLACLSDGRYVVRDRANNILLYTLRWEKLGTEFDTPSDSEGGSGGLSVDNEDRIYASYWMTETIHVFTQDGGAPIRIIPLNGYTPQQIFALSCKRELVTSVWRSVVCVDAQNGDVTRSLKFAAPTSAIPYPAVCRDDSVIIAWVKHEEGCVDIDRYTNELERVSSLIVDHGIRKSTRDWYYVRELETGDIAFCTPDSLYIFCETR